MNTTDQHLPTPPEPFRKVDFSEYDGKYDETVSEKLAVSPDSLSIETLRAYLYGYTFTECYAKGKIPDEMSMDYWEESDNAICDYFVDEPQPADVASEDMWTPNDPSEFEIVDEVLSEIEPEIRSIESNDKYLVDTLQERCILKTIDSTGDGKTEKTALCVTDVSQEYEYLERVFPYRLLKVRKQTLDSNNIDCLEFAENPYGIECIYFDIHRRLDVGYPHP